MEDTMIDIVNRIDIFKRIGRLKKDAVPAFGKMTAQHMIEHLTFAVMFSNGNKPQKLNFPEDKAKMIKAAIVYSERELPIGFKSPVLTDELHELIFPGLKEAIGNLKVQLEEFDNYFVLNKDSTPMNPVAGELDHKEWIVFHNKHFKHHFKQFNLL